MSPDRSDTYVPGLCLWWGRRVRLHAPPQAQAGDIGIPSIRSVPVVGQAVSPASPALTGMLNTATLLFARQPLAYARGSVPHPFGAGPRGHPVIERMRNYLWRSLLTNGELRRADSIRSGPRGTKSGSLKQRANWLCLSKNGIAPPANPPAPGVALPRDHRQHQRGRMLRVMADPLAGLHIARVDPAIRIHHPVTGPRRSHSRDAPPAARAPAMLWCLPRFPSTEERSPAVREAARPASYPEPICRATPATSAWQTMSPLECLAVPVVPAGSPP